MSTGKLKLRTKPYPHQLKAVRRAVAQGNHAFFFDPRCGKTKAALDAVAVLAHRRQVKRVVIVAPIIASSVWVRQLHEHFTMNYRYLDVWGDKHERKKRVDPRVLFFFINVDKLSQRRWTSKGWEHPYSDLIEKWDPDLIIFDESHRLKSSGGVGAQTAWHMVGRLRKRRAERWPYAWDAKKGPKPWVWLLTGTPNPKGYIDLFSQFRIMDDSVFGTARSGFEERHCTFGRGKRQYTVVKYRNTKQLLSKVRAHATVVSSHDAGLAGEYVPNPIYLNLPPKVKELYESFVRDKLLELEGGTVLTAANAGVLFNRCLQITGGYTTAGEEIHRTKLTAITDFLRDLHDQGESVVVGARFLPEVSAVRDLGKRLGYQVSTITGATKPRDRGLLVERFQARAARTPQLFAFQSEAGSLAIELSACAEVAFYSLPSRWDTFWQFINRLGGPNQKNWPIRWTAFVARGTVDVRGLDALKEKRDMHAALMRSPRDFLLGR